MKDLNYISIDVRENILSSYLKKWGLLESARVDLEPKIFGLPKLRRLVDKGIDKANREVDLDRYDQHSEGWYQDILTCIPEPQDLDKYQGLLDEDGCGTEECPKQDLKTLIKDFYPQVRDCIDDIMLNFDFDRVASIMKSLDWRWGSWYDKVGLQHLNEVPDKFAIKVYAHASLKAAIEAAAGNESGGFEVVLEHKPDVEKPLDFKHQVKFGLKFITDDYYA